MKKLLLAFLLFLSYSISLSDDLSLNNGYVIENVRFVDTLNGMMRFKGQDIMVCILPSQILSRQHEDIITAQPAKIYVGNKRQHEDFFAQHPTTADAATIRTVITRHGEIIRSITYQDEDTNVVFPTEYGLITISKDAIVDPRFERESLVFKNPFMITMVNGESFKGELLSSNDSTITYGTSVGSVTVTKANILSVHGIPRDSIRQVPAANSTNSQAADTLMHSSTSGGSIQFQLIGGIGVYYIGDWTASSFFRIGADLSFNHLNGSGDSLESSNYSSTSPYNTGASGNSSQPVHTSNAYRISLSALHVQKLLVYKQTFTYCGIGPLVSYSWSRSTNDINTTYATNQYYSIDGDITENTNKISAVGPFVMLGIRSLLINRVSVSAEIGFSALYQWTTQTNSRTVTETYTNPSESSNTNNNGSISHLEGWDISLYAIRIGLIIEI